MELRHLQYFLVVAEELHFGRAATRLHITQPPLSQQIRQLEDELGVMLFQRTTRRVQLTDAGRAFQEAAQQLLAQAEQAVQLAQRTHRGEIGSLTIGFVGSAMAGRFSDILLAYREHFPQVEVTLLEFTTSQQFEALRQRRIDVGILRPFHPIREAGLELATIDREPFVVVLPKAHPLAKLRRIPLRALAREKVVMVPVHLEPGVEDDIVAFCQRARCYPQRLPGATQLLTMIGLVAAGMGLSLVPASMRTVQWKGIVYRPVQDPMPLADLTAVWRRDTTSSVVQAFVDMIREMIGTDC
ncbi:LysR substrate-binding domain-containing protein [Candidatus Entotheonella palauensis]|uniref:LysR substrate-binding domain-containing protein n=1 Tax=Candidatus Entotheonella palauensis TaxID=93172 RepID=UPI000B7D2922|nr:LysR substrate-binding domain-containing protein [Candidatus Entotheonella palauensis]